jgi:hypothetical protein
LRPHIDVFKSSTQYAKGASLHHVIKGVDFEKNETSFDYRSLRYIVDPKLDPGAKMGLGRPKNKSAQNIFKMNMCVGLIYTNSSQLERAQTGILCETYRGLFVS